MNYQALKSAINNAIIDNNTGEITPAVLRNTLLSIVDKMEEAGPNLVTVTLGAEDWDNNEVTVEVEGVVADEDAQIIQIVPTPSSTSDYLAASVSCTEQGEDTLKFTCESTPSNDIEVNIIITEMN